MPRLAHKSFFDIGRGLLLCNGTLVELEAHTAASIRARPYAISCDGRRLRGLEGGRTAGVAASREYDGRRTRTMGRGSPVELASFPSFASMWTASKSTMWTGVPLVALPVPSGMPLSCTWPRLVETW